MFVFFGVRRVAGVQFGLDIGGSNLWAGISSAVSANLIMVYYVIIAWNEEMEQGKQQKKD